MTTVKIEGVPATGYAEAAGFENPDVLVRLKAWGSLKVGEMPPYQTNWGPPLTKTLNDAAKEIKHLRTMVETLGMTMNE